jgi:threonine/homoserine/homoserine lactone efflux protein
MFNLVQLFFTGMVISFLGTLPLGALNISAMQLAVQEHVRNAIKFSMGVAIVEIFYVRISLTGIGWVVEHARIFYLLEWATVLLFLVLGVSSCKAAFKMGNDEKNVLLNNNIDRFVLGLSMSAVNPAQIPFWFMWSTYLLSTKVLVPDQLAFNIYTLGIGVGTLLGLALFIFAGKWVMNKVKGSHKWLNLAVGIVFLLSAIIQCYRVINKPLRERLQQKMIVTNNARPVIL